MGQLRYIVINLKGSGSKARFKDYNLSFFLIASGIAALFTTIAVVL